MGISWIASPLGLDLTVLPGAAIHYIDLFIPYREYPRDMAQVREDARFVFP